MKQLLFLIAFSYLFSCVQKGERFYKSDDEVTGGFYNFSLYLLSDNKLFLTIEVSKAVSENEAGGVFDIKKKEVTGKWNVKNEVINYTLDESKSSIDSVFLDTDFDYLVNNSIIRFSSKSDTAYIYGIPCVMIEEK
jgi:hypothetical protein